jgi:hypothetical protein
VLKEVCDNLVRHFISSSHYVAYVLLHTYHEVPHIASKTARVIHEATRKLINLVEEFRLNLFVAMKHPNSGLSAICKATHVMLQT